jgi:mRNA interferase HigB
MKVIGKPIIDEYSQRHADARSPVEAWLAEVEDANWQSPKDVKYRYPNASILSDNRVVFNIKGNKYRIDTKLSYIHQIVFIKRMGTHAEYLKWSF